MDIKAVKFRKDDSEKTDSILSHSYLVARKDKRSLTKTSAIVAVCKTI